MLSYISGEIIAKRKNYVIVKTDKLGYKVHLKPTDFSCFQEKQKVEFFLHSHVREDAFDLFGFRTFEELLFFESLIDISGIGPKTGLAILCLGNISKTKEAIESRDVSYLTKVSGIGKKTANRVILELQGQLAKEESEEKGSEKEDALCALIELGYRKNEALKALEKTKGKTPEEQVKEALKLI